MNIYIAFITCLSLSEAAGIRVPIKEIIISVSHSNDYEESCLLGYNTMYTVESRPKFQRRHFPPKRW